MWRRIGKVLAAIYVMIALAPLVGMSAMFVWQFFQPSPWERPMSSAVKSTERAKELAAKGLYEQKITYGNEVLGLRKDTATGRFDLYAIGISQTTMAPEIAPMSKFQNEIVPNLLPPNAERMKYVASTPLVGPFNNVVIFDAVSGEVTKLFDRRLAISIFSLAPKPGLESLLVFASEKDTNKDGELSGVDWQDVYIYAMRDKSTRKVSGFTANPVQVIEADGGDYVLVRAVHDDGGTHKWTPSPSGEPELLFKVDLKTATASEVIPQRMLNELQRTLNASEPKPGTGP